MDELTLDEASMGTPTFLLFPLFVVPIIAAGLPLAVVLLRRGTGPLPRVWHRSALFFRALPQPGSRAALSDLGVAKSRR